MKLDAIRARLDSRREHLRSLRVGVLAGGTSAEREVSLSSGAAVIEELSTAGYQLRLISISESTRLEETVAALRDCQVIFTVMHGTLGEDGVFQGVFELLDLPYVSADVHGSALAMDKLATKRISQSLGLLTPDYWVVRADDSEPVAFPADITELVIKPVQQGSSVGIKMTSNDSQTWPAARQVAQQYGTVLVERRIFGRELTAGVLGHSAKPSVLPIVEIRPAEGFYDYKAKYTAGGSNYICPAEIDPQVADKVRQGSELVYRELGLGPYARIDFILDDEGRAWFLEANTLPGFTNLSLLPMAAGTEGMDFTELVEVLLLLAVERHEQGGGK